ncbi:hypothetical protein MACK_000109 [Theileria orientalis]|uniref:AP2/ERF domain-containing protein n=1 Tax=Theileria orientalis TaxID=68886 RepID=A0A976M9D7_THEOR|nr:hypothetical protein MACK_000109 [Theileria orientalis]
MANDTSTGQFAVIESDVKDTENQTHPASEKTNVHDVDTLLSCINIWKKNSQECTEPTNKDVPNQDRISIKLNNDVQRVNNVVNGLLSMTGLRAEIPKNVVVAKSDSKKKQMDKSTLISAENFPMELSDDEDLPPHLRRNHTSDATIDTRFASESSDENNGEFDFPFNLNKDPNYLTLQMIDSQGNSVGSRGPDSEDERLVCSRIGITNINMMQLESIDHEIHDPEEPMEVDESIDYDNVGQFVHAKEDFETTVENSGTIVQIDRPVAVVETKSTSKGRNSRKKSASGRRRNYRRRVGTVQNPLLALGSIECPIITEDGILRQGKNYSNLKQQASIPSEAKVNGKSLRTVKNVNRNPQADEVVDNRVMEFEKIRGVCYCKSDNSWTAWWTEKGKSRKKAFKLSLYGYEGARRMAIEHRMRMEELLPELKEKKTKMNRRKSSEALGPKNNKKSPGTISRNTTRPCSNTPAATVPSMEDGIFKGTRNKSKENKEKQGEFFAEDTFQTNLNPAIDSNLPTPQINQVPFSDSRQNTADTHSDNKDTIVNTNHNANLAPTNCKRPNGTCNMGYTNNVQYKRRRPNSYHQANGRMDEIEYFRNLERNLEEEMERRNMASNQGVPLQNAVQQNPQISATVNILSHTIEQSSAESDTTQNTKPPKECKVNSLHCRIKLEKSTLEEFQKAIRNALENLPDKETANEQGKENESPVITLTQQDTQNPQSPNSEQNYVNVDALCISHNGADNKPLFNIIPTYVDGSHGKKVLAFVVLNS